MKNPPHRLANLPTSTILMWIGAQGVLRALIDRGAIGLASTHDMALVDGARLRPGALKNVHFQDELESGRFGAVIKQCVELMRAIGLDV